MNELAASSLKRNAKSQSNPPCVGWADQGHTCPEPGAATKDGRWPALLPILPNYFPSIAPKNIAASAYCISAASQFDPQFRMIRKPRLVRHPLLALLLTASLLLPGISLAQLQTGIGPIATNTPLGFAPTTSTGEPRINWINGEYQETHPAGTHPKGNQQPSGKNVWLQRCGETDRSQPRKPDGAIPL